MSETIEQLRIEANSKLDPKKKSSLGQFMTPYKIAEFMANLFEQKKCTALLDAGAGIGSLTVACSNHLQIEKIEAWEIDKVMLGYLHRNLDNLNIAHEVHEVDFILDSVERIKLNSGTKFSHAILNPPYKKINQKSDHRLACREIGLETVNLYTCFLAMSILQMADGGEIVIIIPRSFCNGPYYKPFREIMLKKCSIDSIHVFESRNKAFKDDEVLQENIILKLTRGKPQGKVLLSFSHDSEFTELQQREVDFSVIVHPDDKELFVRVPTDDVDHSGTIFANSLKDIGIDVCTGPVVDFRLKDWWSMDFVPGTVPTVYPHHFTKDGFQQPKDHKKPNALHRGKEVDKWLMVSGTYVLVRRFSAKEEKRRVVAYLITPEDIKSDLVGFENHWNVFHIKKNGLDLSVAKGLCCFLNSTVLDDYFRVFSGHTQVNATDLRNMKYPSIEILSKLGESYEKNLTQEQINNLIGTV
jgi:adenine-specific DNA-methyltransferase